MEIILTILMKASQILLLCTDEDFTHLFLDFI